MTLAAVLLSGGESRRMGRDKATLAWEGMPLWQRQISLLRQLSPAALFVSAREAPPWLPADARFVADPPPVRGPLGGLAATLAAMSGSSGPSPTHLLALPIDMPAMTAGHLATLWRDASPGCGVLPWLGDEPEPLPAIYPAEASPVAAGSLAGGERSLKALARALVATGHMKTHMINARDANLYVNCNSPTDWQRFAAYREQTRD